MKFAILGAGGSIGNPLAQILLNDKHDVRLVSRSGYAMQDADTMIADMTRQDDAIRAVSGAHIAILTLGLQYNLKIWQEFWPRIMKNVIEACKQEGTKLIFFDNVYMYGLVHGKMTEQTPYNPSSKKGEVRVKIARMIENEFNGGSLTASIARSADLYGPWGDKSSVPYIMVLDKLLKSKKPQWMVNADSRHSFTYTLDAARALYMLAMDEKTFGQVWHLPTSNPGITGREFIKLAASELSAKPEFSLLKKWMIKMAGIFNPTIGELVEMNYQLEYDYHFISDKFESYFNYKPTAYNDGIRETILFYKKGS